MFGLKEVNLEQKIHVMDEARGLEGAGKSRSKEKRWERG